MTQFFFPLSNPTIPYCRNTSWYMVISPSSKNTHVYLSGRSIYQYCSTAHTHWTAVNTHTCLLILYPCERLEAESVFLKVLKPHIKPHPIFVSWFYSYLCGCVSSVQVTGKSIGKRKVPLFKRQAFKLLKCSVVWTTVFIVFIFCTF